MRSLKNVVELDMEVQIQAVVLAQYQLPWGCRDERNEIGTDHVHSSIVRRSENLIADPGRAQY